MMQRRHRSATPRAASTRGAVARSGGATNQPNDSQLRASAMTEASHANDITSSPYEHNRKASVPGYLRGTKASESRKVEVRGHSETRETTETRETAKRPPFSLVSSNRFPTPKSIDSTSADASKGVWKRQAVVSGHTLLSPVSLVAAKSTGVRSSEKPQATKQVRFAGGKESKGALSSTVDSTKASHFPDTNGLPVRTAASLACTPSELPTPKHAETSPISHQVEANYASTMPRPSNSGFTIGSTPARKSKIPNASAFRSKLTSLPSRAFSAVTNHFAQSQPTVRSPENRLGMSPVWSHQTKMKPNSDAMDVSKTGAASLSLTDSLKTEVATRTDSPTKSNSHNDLETWSKRAPLPSKMLSIETLPLTQSQLRDPSPEKPLGISPPWSQPKNGESADKAEQSSLTPMNFTFGFGESNAPTPTSGLGAMLGMFSTFSEVWNEPANDEGEDFSSVESSLDIPSIILRRQSLGGVSEISANSESYSMDVTSEGDEETTSTISSIPSSPASSAQRTNSSNSRLLRDDPNDTCCDDEEDTSQQELLRLPECLRVQHPGVHEDFREEKSILELRSCNSLPFSVGLEGSGGQESTSAQNPDIVSEADSAHCLPSPTLVEEEFPHGMATICVGRLLKTGGDDSISESSESQTSNAFKSELVEDATKLLDLRDCIPLPVLSDDFVGAYTQDESLPVGDDSQFLFDALHHDETPAIDEAIELFSNEVALADYHEYLLDDLNPTLDHSLWLLTLSMTCDSNQELFGDATLPGYLSDEAMEPHFPSANNNLPSDSRADSLIPVLQEQGTAVPGRASSPTNRVKDIADAVGTSQTFSADIPHDPSIEESQRDTQPPGDDEIQQLRIRVEQLSQEKTALERLLASADEQRIHLLEENERLEELNLSLKAFIECSGLQL